MEHLKEMCLWTSIIKYLSQRLKVKTRLKNIEIKKQSVAEKESSAGWDMKLPKPLPIPIKQPRLVTLRVIVPLNFTSNWFRYFLNTIECLFKIQSIYILTESWLYGLLPRNYCIQYWLEWDRRAKCWTSKPGILATSTLPAGSAENRLSTESFNSIYFTFPLM